MFQSYMEKTLQKKVVEGLIPVLDHVYKSGIEVDLQDMFQRLTFDNICILVLGCDPKTLCVELSKVAHGNAYDELEETIFLRHVLPPSWWKLQRWLQIGAERKYSKAWKAFEYEFLYQCISSKRQEFIADHES